MAQYRNMYEVDLDKGPAIVSINNMHSGDVLANRIGAIVVRAEEPVSLTGTCAGTVIRFDGTTVAVSGTVSANTCYIDLPAAAYAVAGPVQVFVSLTSGGATTTLVDAFGTVTNTDTGIIASGTVPDSVADLIAAIESAVSTIPADYSELWTTLSPAYSTSTSYAVGDCVTYNGKLYKCTAPTSGNFDNQCWSAVTVTGAAFMGGSRVAVSTELSDANDALTNRVYTIAATGISNLPVDDIFGTLICFCHNTGTGINGTAQIFIATDGKCFERIRWGGRTPLWSAWVRCDNRDVNSAISTLQTDMTAAQGDIDTAEGNISTLQTDMAAVQGDIDTAEGNISTLQTDIAAVQGDISALQTSTGKAIQNVAAAYNEATTYYFGDYCTRNGDLYRCTATSVTGTWDSSKWSQTRVNFSALMAGGAPGAVSDLADADEAIPNRIYTFNVTQTDANYVVNLPYAKAKGTLITFAYLANVATGKMQIFVSNSGVVYTRIYWSSSWSGWTKITGAITELGARNGVEDFDDMLANRVYTLTTDIDNTPDTSLHGTYGTALTFNGDASQTNGEAMIHVGRNNDVYTRIKWDNTWKSWERLAKASETITLGDYCSGIGMFPRFGVVGDSFASGVIYVTGSENADTHHYSLSWPQILARLSGCVGVNYTRGGMTTKGFITNTTWGLPKLLSDIQGGNGCGLYLLCLGINDSNSSNPWGGINDLGSSADVDTSDPDNNADTFWGNYCRIISHIKTAAPDARIVMCTFKRIPTTATEEGYVPFNNAIKAIAEYNNIPCIDLADDAFFNSTYYLNNMVGYHPTAPQYVGYAKAIDRLLSKCVVANYNYFKVWTNGQADP